MLDEEIPMTKQMTFTGGQISLTNLTESDK